MYTYAVKSIVDLNKTEGAYLNAVFWVSWSHCRKLFKIPVCNATHYHKHISWYRKHENAIE